MKQDYLVLPSDPWWMKTFWGRWLCKHWPPAVALRRALSAANEYKLAQYQAAHCSEKVGRSIKRWVEADFSDASKAQLIGDWRDWNQAVLEEQQARLNLMGRP